MSKKHLWARLVQYKFEDTCETEIVDHMASIVGGHSPHERAFARYLHSSMGWDTSFAYQAIDEYKKFLYLGVIADFVVSPSSVIDAIWHAHMELGRYDEFCENVLGYPFRHTPAGNTSDDGRNVYAQREATMALYEQEFGQKPPIRFWDPGVYQPGGKTVKRTGDRLATDDTGRRYADDNSVLVDLVDTIAQLHTDTVHHGSFNGEHGFGGSGAGHDFGKSAIEVDDSPASGGDDGGGGGDGDSGGCCGGD